MFYRSWPPYLDAIEFNGTRRVLFRIKCGSVCFENTISPVSVCVLDGETVKRQTGSFERRQTAVVASGGEGKFG